MTTEPGAVEHRDDAERAAAERATAERDRRGARVVFLVLGGPLTLLLIVVTTIAITGTLARQSESTSLAFTGAVERIEIFLTNGSITVRGGATESVVGERVLTRGLQSPAITERIDGTTLFLEATCFPLGNTWCDVSYVLDVPSAVEVKAHTAIGSVLVSNVSGGTDVGSATGTVTVEDTSGPLVLASGAGSIRGSGLRSATVEASTGAGSVELRFAASPQRVAAEAGAGSVDIELPRDGATYQIEEVPGSDSNIRVAVTTDPSSDRVLRLESGAGSVSVHYPEA
jgi:hypothetical protein